MEKINYIDNSEFYKREILDGKTIYHNSKDIQQYVIKDGKLKFISNYFIGEEEDDFSGEVYIKDIVKASVFPELEMKVADIFNFDF